MRSSFRCYLSPLPLHHHRRLTSEGVSPYPAISGSPSPAPHPGSERRPFSPSPLHGVLMRGPAAGVWITSRCMLFAAKSLTPKPVVIHCAYPRRLLTFLELRCGCFVSCVGRWSTKVRVTNIILGSWPNMMGFQPPLSAPCMSDLFLPDAFSPRHCRASLTMRVRSALS